MFLAAIAASALLFTGCSGDDSSDPVTDPIEEVSFTSSILIQGQAFAPSENSMAPSVMTHFQAGVENGMNNVRTFHLIKTGTNINSTEAIQLTILYPFGQNSVNGTYSFNFDDVEENFAQGMYVTGTSGYVFNTGTITVTDMGENKFKLVLNNVVSALMTDESNTKTVTGSFEGTFTDM